MAKWRGSGSRPFPERPGTSTGYQRRPPLDRPASRDLPARLGWLLGPDGWSLEVCEIDLRPGGKYRYVWRRESDKSEMGMGGMYREIVVPERIVNTEVFDDPWYEGEAVGTTTLVERGGHARRKVEPRSRRQGEFARRAVADERNFVKKGVVWALRAIGERDLELNAAAVAVPWRLAE